MVDLNGIENTKVYLRVDGAYCTLFLQSCRAAELNRKVAEWLECHGVDVDALSDGSGCGFEELMYGLNIADELCERIEREAANADISQK